MTYATGSLSTATQLINTLESFANANGWTTNLAAALGANRRLHLQKGNAYANFSTNEGPLINMYGSSGFNGASAWNAQPAPISTVTNCPLSVNGSVILPCTYHLFAQSSPDFIGAVFVSSNNTITYMVFGQMEKIGSYAGGEFYGAGDPLANAGSIQGVSAGAMSLTLYAKNASAFYTVTNLGYSVGVDTRFGIAPLMPIRAFEPVGAAYKPRGVFPWIRIAGRVYNNGTDITYGSDVWAVFNTAFNLSYWMIAFKK